MVEEENWALNGCPLMVTCAQWHTCSYTHTHTCIPSNKYKNWKTREREGWGTEDVAQLDCLPDYACMMIWLDFSTCKQAIAAIFPALGRWGQEEQGSKVIPGYTVWACPGIRKTLFPNKQKGLFWLILLQVSAMIDWYQLIWGLLWDSPSWQKCMAEQNSLPHGQELKGKEETGPYRQSS